MRTISLMIVCVAGLFIFNPQPAAKKVLNAGQPANALDSIDFTTMIQPILQKNCMPCHFPEGKMYEKMPFDKAETILTHEQGVMKRFKGTADLPVIEAFFKQMK